MKKSVFIKTKQKKLLENALSEEIILKKVALTVKTILFLVYIHIILANQNESNYQRCCFVSVCRGPYEPRSTDVRQRARHQSVRHDVCDEKRGTTDHAGTAVRPRQPGAHNQATGSTFEDTTINGRLLQEIIINEFV